MKAKRIIIHLPARLQNILGISAGTACIGYGLSRAGFPTDAALILGVGIWLTALSVAAHSSISRWEIGELLGERKQFEEQQKGE